MISSSWSIAGGFSILASSPARPPTSGAPRRRPRGAARTRAPIQSTPRSSAKARSARSFRSAPGAAGDVGHVDALAVREPAAGQHLGHERDPAPARSRAARIRPSSSSSWLPSRARRRSPDGAADTRLASPGVGVEVEPERAARRELDGPPEPPDAQLGALQVGQHADRPPGAARPRGSPVAVGVLLVAAVAEVQAEHVRARLEQGANAPGVEDAGPSVARILVERERRIGRYRQQGERGECCSRQTG